MFQYSVEQVAQQCVEENRLFERVGKSNPDYCFELFRRALQEKSDEALSYIRAIYFPKIHKWIRDYWLFEQTREDIEYFCQEAFMNFYFAAIGPRFSKFKALGQLINYLKVCVFSAVKQYLRDQKPAALMPEDIDLPATDAALHELRAEVLWRYICTLLPDETERLLAWLSFVLEMKPREIAPNYPQLWKDEHQVSRMLYTIRKHLYQDRLLRNWLENDEVQPGQL
jgi:hypothetical protein